MSMPPLWHISADTGGTFTDCIGTAPDGGVHRAKVLSTGVVRARVRRIEGASGLEIAVGEALPEAFWVGATLRATAFESRVVGDTPADGRRRLALADAPPAGIGAGDSIELLTGEESPILGARLLTRTPVSRPLPAMHLRVATTRGTNALLERRGQRVGLFITAGFGDLIEIGTQQRPNLFALDIVKPLPLYEGVVEVRERLDSDGAVLLPLDEGAVADAARGMPAAGVRAAAVVLLHSWINPAHERRLAAVLTGLGFEHVSISSSLAPAIKLLPRAQTAVVNAYLAGAVGEYLGRIEGSLRPGSRLHAMTSAGSLLSPASFQPKDSLLSGPAGGVVGAAAAARASGFHRVITFDMGGTSTDAARFDGAHEYTVEHTVADATIVAPAVAVESVAAGGGSVCWFDAAGHAGLRVGPRSAGADPGPACYGRGGPLTITDCNLLLGRLDAGRLSIPLSPGAARARAEELLALVRRETGEAIELGPMLEGLIEIANQRMAQAIHAVSVARGYDSADHALVAFGGAGPQHACEVAELLDIKMVLVPADAGLLSAAGLASASIQRFATRQMLRPLNAIADLGEVIRALGERACGVVLAEGEPGAAVTRRTLHLRLAGQEAAIPIDVASDDDIERAATEAFTKRFRGLYGYPPPARPVELESITVVASSASRARSEPTAPGVPARDSARPGPIRPLRTIRGRFQSRDVEIGVYERAMLPAGAGVTGPALILEPHATTVLPPGWTLRVDAAAALVMSRSDARPGGRPSADRRPGAVRDELFLARLTAIADDMGRLLRRTSLSTNVKERLDFSCALLDADARLVVNAPHIPVHLGALGECVRRVRDVISLSPGDTVVTNHPAFGGSHLPDITLITPVYLDGTLLGYAASRAHHAEVGGVSPGSMPVGTRSLAEEGVVIPPMYFTRAGESRLADVERVLLAAPYPTRALAENIADLQAQAAANALGAARLTVLARELGAASLAAGMNAVVSRAARVMGRALARLPRGGLAATETLDDGSPISVRIERAGDRATIDFAGSARVHPAAFNAPLGVVRSAVLYVLRLLIDEDLPLSEGLLAPITLMVPRGMLNPAFDADPARCPPVAAGNVETSQRVADALTKALGLAACSQGTMNNVIFGNDRFGYYETICGGAGATRRAPGAHAVHTHMTNTRITDPEILERRYPVRLRRFAVRRGSGGLGRHNGGDGVVREYEFLGPVRLSLITQHRAVGPFGADGGGGGRAGAQVLIDLSGREIPLGGVESRDVHAGEVLRVETPGGGGWGSVVQTPTRSTVEPSARR